jgi:AraC family transcriptional regulator, regulatory protein of adaptative response / DNA-3-methyladenine glycosylase II
MRSENVQPDNFGCTIMGWARGMDLEVCSRARLARDARFDGKFFIAVMSTGIYCRPICRSRTSKESNVRYFPTAAAAAAAGFRPCLRCRPECSPGTPAWLGTQNTVARALRLIDESGLGDGGVEALAERLGIGARHLRRLFLRHLGAPPSTVAQTRRLQFAKKLIDSTSLPMIQVAVASGFGCVRRFNAAIRNVYHRSPTEIRDLARQKAVPPENQYLFRLSYRPPYDWNGMLAYLAPRATPGVEAVAPGVYRRSIAWQGHRGYLEVSGDENNDALAVRVHWSDPRSLFFIIARLRAMFDLDADWTAIAQSLKGDPALRRQVEANPGLRVPGCWNGFELAVRAILGQQITVAGATALAGRLVRKFGQAVDLAGGLTHLFPSPEVLAAADFAELRLPASRGETISALARAVCDGQISFEQVVDSDSLLERLEKVRGIGKWTAQYVAMRALGEPDAFPSADIGLLRALGLRSSRELEQLAEAWRPWRAYAAMYLWSTPGDHGGKTTRFAAGIPAASRAKPDDDRPHRTHANLPSLLSRDL